MSVDLASLTARLSPEQQRTVKARYRAQAKNPTTAFLLCFFLGLFGVHRFYLGDVAGGVVRLVLFPLIIPGLILEIIDLARIDAEVEHSNLAAAEHIIARVMLDHPDSRFVSQASELVDASLAQSAAPAAAPLAAAVVPLAAAGAATVAPAAAPEPAPPPFATPTPEPASAAQAASIPAMAPASPPPPVWPVPPEYQPEPAFAPPALRHETDSTPYPPLESPRATPTAPPQEAQTVPWGDLAAGAAASGTASLSAADVPAAPPAPPAAAPSSLAGVDPTDQAGQLAEGSALADVGEPLGERVQVRLPGADDAGAAASTLVFHPEDAPLAPAPEPDWGTAAAIGAGALGGAAAYEAYAPAEPAPVAAPPAAAVAPAASPVAEPAPTTVEPEHRTVKRVRVVRRLMVDGKVVQETAAEEVVDADADTAATAARLREELGTTDPDTLASLAQQAVDPERKP
jgi:hypothetical protein